MCTSLYRCAWQPWKRFAMRLEMHAGGKGEFIICPPDQVGFGHRDQSRTRVFNQRAFAFAELDSKEGEGEREREGEREEGGGVPWLLLRCC
jgi:hypothetical protein